jgi:hypothetical protein
MERDEHITPIDDRLLKAWDCYSRKQSFYLIKEYDAFASELLGPIRPPLSHLHHCILSILRSSDDVSHIGWMLGVFVSAGYRFVPEEVIRYDLHTPEIHHLGYRLRGKHLVIDGTVGQSVGCEMIGALTVNGAAGKAAGLRMIGTFTNNGVLGDSPAECMRGVFSDNTGAILRSPYPFLGIHNDRLEGIAAKEKAMFLHAITNPGDLDYDELDAHLRAYYGGAQNETARP